MAKNALILICFIGKATMPKNKRFFFSWTIFFCRWDAQTLTHPDLFFFFFFFFPFRKAGTRNATSLFPGLKREGVKGNSWKEEEEEQEQNLFKDLSTDSLDSGGQTKKKKKKEVDKICLKCNQYSKMSQKNKKKKNSLHSMTWRRSRQPIKKNCPWEKNENQSKTLPNQQRWHAIWKLSFCTRLAPNLYAQSVLIEKKNSALELSQKFIKGALLVGFQYFFFSLSL